MSTAAAHKRLAIFAAHLPQQGATDPASSASCRSLQGAAASAEKYKVLLVGTMAPDGPNLLRARDDIELVQIDREPDGSLIPTPERVKRMQAAVATADALVMRTTPLQKDTIALAKRLRVVGWHGVGFDPVDVAALQARKIPLLLPGAANSVSVAEQTMMMMLAVARKAVIYDRSMRTSEGFHIRETNSCLSLEGKTVLVVGFGRIGTRVASRCAAFGMKIVVSDPAIPRRAVEGLGYEFCADFHERLADADVLTLHIPAREDGTPVLGPAEFASMKQSVILVNCARGSLVDEAALVDALSSGKLHGAGLDTLQTEPPPLDHPLFTLDPAIPVICSPHSAPSTRETSVAVSLRTCQNVLDMLDGAGFGEDYLCPAMAPSDFE